MELKFINIINHLSSKDKIYRNQIKKLINKRNYRYDGKIIW